MALRGLGWRSIFWFLAAVGLLLVVVSVRFLPRRSPEHRQSFHPVALLDGYREVGINRRFLLPLARRGIQLQRFFLYIVSAPVFLGEHLHLGPQEYAWLFLPCISAS
jgi:DHA1 family bicyclomycin/chloramphenicol resistance-like MFS transporter